MKTRWTMALATAALLLPAGLLRADGPPAKEKKPAPKKVITEDELRSAGRRGTVYVGTPDAPADEKAGEKPSGEASKDTTAGGEAKPDAAAKAEPTEDEKRDTRRKEIQSEVDYQSANIKTLQDQVNKAQTELNDLTDMTFAAPGTGTGRRTALLKLIDDANAQIKASQETIEKLEEQARREGIAVSRP